MGQSTGRTESPSGGPTPARPAERGRVSPGGDHPARGQGLRRAVALRRHRAQGAVQGGARLRGQGTAGGPAHMLEPRRRPGLQGGRLARRGPRRLVGAPPRRAAERNRRRIPRVRRRAEAGSEGRRGARRPRRHRHGQGALRRLGLRGVFDRRQVPGPAHRLDGHLVQGPRGLQPLRQPRQRPQANRRPQQRRSCWRSRTPSRSRSRRSWASTSRNTSPACGSAAT